MGVVQSNPLEYKNLVECRVEADSSDVASKIWFDTPPVTQDLLDRLDTIQLTTTSHNENPGAAEDELGNCWFELVIYRSWDRSRPRRNLATKHDLAWYSHASPAYETEAGTEVKGSLFQRGHELLNEIEAGDVIAVRVCAKYRNWVNYAIKGEIAVSFRDEALPLAPTTYLAYPYSSIGPCYVHSTDHVVSSKIWFSTPPLDQSTIDKLHEIQLFTESKDQGWADDKSWSYSWFEIVVLESQDVTIPLKKNGYELAWRSHGNNIGIDEEAILEGTKFDRSHDLLRGLLVEGNSIGVRVCTRFVEWRNIASEGRLELRFAEPVTQKKLVKSQNQSKEAAVAAAVNVKMIQALEDFQEKSKALVEVDKRATDQVNEPMQWGGDYGLNKHALSILSLDGGGVRGLSSLLILKAIMAHVRGLNGEALMPYQCFDLIVGTSTGGLIAIMLGRLQMPIDQCIKEYCDLASEVFGGKPAVENYKTTWGFVKKYWNNAVNFVVETIPKYAQLASESHMYSGDKLKKVIQDVLKRSVPPQNPDAQMLDVSTDCHVAVFACRANNINNERAQHFRTYPLLDDKSHTYKIWEAARATTAAPAYFERITVGGDDYVDGGLQVNNPILAAAIEARAAFGKARNIGCTLSLGTGRPPDMALSDNPGVTGMPFNLWNLAESLVSLATNSELMHLNVQDLNKQNIFPGEYFRFNATVDIPKQGDPKFRDKMIGLDDVASLPRFRELTEEYLSRSDVQQVIKQCAEILNNLYREKHSRSQ